MNRYRYKMILAYDGSQYSGWQRQPNGVTIQEVIEQAFMTLFQHPVKVLASSRTDAGVHALGQVAHCTLDHHIEPRKLLYSLNGILPRDIRVKTLEETSLEFHARFQAKRKIYHYHLHCEPFHDPSTRFYSYHVSRKMDIDKLKKAAAYFIGTHNFKAFANENTLGAAKTSPIKTLYALNVVEERGGLRLEFEGSGFLYKMVRNIVGTLLECSFGKLDPNKIPELFASEDRRQSPKAAPAHGLFLIRIDY